MELISLAINEQISKPTFEHINDWLKVHYTVIWKISTTTNKLDVRVESVGFLKAVSGQSL